MTNDTVPAAGAAGGLATGTWHLHPARSSDFFDVVHHPQVRCEADADTLDGNTLKARGRLQAAGKHIPLHVDATVTPVDGELGIEATALADHRELGMTWSPMGSQRAPSKLIIRGRLVRAEDAR